MHEETNNDAIQVNLLWGTGAGVMTLKVNDGLAKEWRWLITHKVNWREDKAV